MSKTVGNVVDPFPFIERYGIDALRYYLAREVRFGEDGTFAEETFEARYTAELANDLGNLLNRTVSMIARYRDGAVPADPGGDVELAGEVAEHVAAVRTAIDDLDVTGALETTWGLVRRLNRLVEERAPWTLARDPGRGEELDRALFGLAEGLRATLILLWPYIPGSAERGLRALGQSPDAVGLDGAAWGAGTPGAQVEPAEPLFPRVEVAA